MHALSTLLFAGLSTATYTLSEDYPIDSSFFDKFTFYTETDPTDGYVTYVDNSTAASDGLISASGGSVYIGVDDTNVASGSGRNSVRLTSTSTYTEGLIILDLGHMPSSTCGTWPAFWMLGSDWPNNGEIDIIEGVNQQSTNQMTLHTSDGCTINNSGSSGSLETSNCYVEASGQSSNAGCAIIDSSTSSYGDGFNNADGGVYATEWTSDAISIWHFTNSSVPSDITSGSPDPSGWGTPDAMFSGDCDISSHFSNLQIVFDITFCGDWAGDVWSDGSCSSYASTCDDYVQNNPTAFSNTYWSINSLKVYQESSSTSSSAGASASISISVGDDEGESSHHSHGHTRRSAHGRGSRMHRRSGHAQ
ncbi:concanavalin A-like lectin/glucanase domain-containing protein [Penicillium malachiteum]|nr:concanavalin A-like lectin/glucanase domain-containing protein [Penicillium malachiteum]